MDSASGKGARRIIWVSDPNDVALLIHEICHAYALGHGLCWQRRALVAAHKAEEIGMCDLAAQVRRNVAAYQSDEGSWRITATTIYGQIEDAVRDCPDAPYKLVREHVRNDNGLSKKEFDMKYPRGREVWRQARKMSRVVAQAVCRSRD